MGVTYTAICHNCKTYRDLGKAGWATPKTYEQAMKDCEDLKTSQKLYNVLIGFCFFQDHIGHLCTMNSEQMDGFDIEAAGYHEDLNYFDPT